MEKKRQSMGPAGSHTVDDDARQRLLKDLETFYGKLVPAELGVILTQIEEFISQAIVHEAGQLLARAMPQVQQTPAPGVVSFSGAIFQVVATTRDALSPSAFALTVIAMHGKKPMQPVRRRGVISGHGRFDSITVIVDPIFAGCADDLALLGARFFEAGYAWELELVRRTVRSIESSLAEHLYRHVRERLQSDLQRFVWFVVITQDRGGVYIFDSTTAESTIELLKEGLQRRSGSTSELFVELLLTVLPLEEMFSRNAIATGECLSVQLDVTGYRGSSAGYAQAEDFVYPGGSASVFPVVREGRAYLIAAFPTIYQSDMLPALEGSRRELERIFRDYRDGIRTTLRRVTETTRFALQEFATDLLAKLAVELAKLGGGSS